MEENELTIKKVPLQNFIVVLVELYNRGVDFVDLIGTTGERQDYMAVTFTREYMSKEGIEYFNEIDEEEKEIKITDIGNLSDEDLNQMI